MYAAEGIRTEILLRNNEWYDVSSNVRGEGAGEGIRITSGRKNERTRTSLNAVFTLTDPNGLFNDQNPRSSLYGLIGRNTQCRVQCGKQRALTELFNRSLTDAWNMVRYSFDATDEGWVGEGSTSVSRITTAANVHDGAGALQATKTMGSGFDSLRFNDASGLADDISAAGDTIAIWAKVPTGAGGGNWLAHIEVQDSTFTWIPTTDTQMIPGTWTLLTFVDPGSLFANCRAIGVQFSAEGVNGSQSVHIDTVWQYDSPDEDEQIFWTNTTSVGSVPADFDVNGTHGTHTHPNANQLHYSTVDIGERNHRIRARVKLSAGTLTGANASTWVLARFTDTSNYYACLVTMTTAGDVTMQLHQRVLGTLTSISDSLTTHSGYSGQFNTVEFIIEVYVEGAEIFAKMWDATNFSEPNEWQLRERITSLTSGNSVGVADRREASNTNANLQFQYNSIFIVPGTIRGHFEIPNFGALEWTPGGYDIKQNVEAAGLKRRLGAASAPVLKSPVYREVTSLGSHTNIVGYWPMEEGIHTTQIGSGLSGGIPMNVNGTNVQFGATSNLPGIESMVALGDGASLSVPVITSTDTGTIRAILFVQFPEAGTLPDNAAIMEIHQTKDASIRKWRLVYGTGGSLKLWGYNQSFTLVADSGAFGFGVDNSSSMIMFDVVQNGANVDWAINQKEIMPDGSSIGTGASGTFNTVSVGAINGASIAPIPGLSGCAVSHFILANSTGIFSTLDEPMIGYWNETASDRFERLCNEEGISYHVEGTTGTSTSARMGAQRIATLLQNLEDIEDTERGIIYEARQFFGLVFRQHHTLLNQADDTFLPSLSYSDLSGEPFPLPDDLEIGNDVTATRAFGGEYRSVETEGPMSASEYPDGIGRYELPVATRVMQDSQLANIARWERHIGTWIGPRYPNIQLEMHRSVIADDTATTDAIAEMEIGDYFPISSLPIWLPPEKIEVLSQGYTEVIRNTHWTISHNAVPAQPYRVAVRDSEVDGTPFVRDSIDSEVDSTYTIGSTSLVVQVNLNPAWVTGSVDFDIMVAGVRLHVTNIGSVVGNTQTFTVDSTPVNGITTPMGGTTIPAGTPVHVYPQARRALQKASGNVSFSTDGNTIVTGVDTPPARWLDGENTGVFTNSSFAESDQGLIFTAPSSGRIMLSYSGRLINDTAAQETLMGTVIRVGSVIGDGSTFEAASDGKCLRVIGTDHKQISITRLVEGLTAGRDYNIVFCHRRSGGNAQVNERFLLVRPDRTQGGRPGTVIEEVPESTLSEQGPSDTTTSTSYTTADMTVCGENFIAPASGKIMIHFSAQMDNSGADTILVSYHIRTGATINAGTDVVTPGDTRAIALAQVNNIEMGTSIMASGLTPGDSYNIVLEHRVTGGTGTLVDRRVAVEQVF